MQPQIDFDELSEEILRAENYLKNAPGSLRASFPAGGSSRSVFEPQSVSASLQLPAAKSLREVQRSDFAPAPAPALTLPTPPDHSEPSSPDSVDFTSERASAQGSSSNAESILRNPPRSSAGGSTGPRDSSPSASRSKPKAAVSATATAVAQPPRAPDSDVGRNRSPVGDRGKKSSIANNSSGTGTYAAAAGQGQGRYNSSKDKEMLIARLLAEHDGSRGGDHSSVPPPPPPSSSSSSSPSRGDSRSPSRQPPSLRGGPGQGQGQEYERTYSANSATAGIYGAGKDVASGRLRSGTGTTDVTSESVSYVATYASSESDGAAIDAEDMAQVADTLFFASDLGDNDSAYDAVLGFDGDGPSPPGTAGEAWGAGAAVDEFAQTVDMSRARRPFPFPAVGGQGATSAQRNASERGKSQTAAAGAGSGGGTGTGTRRTKGILGADAENDATLLSRARAASNMPSRLVESANREWKYVKSRDDCLREGEQSLKQTYTFKPVLSTKVRRQAKFEPVLDKRSSGDRGGKAAADKAGVGAGAGAGGDQRHALINKRIEESVKQHERSLQNREKLRKNMEEMESRACTFQPQISKGAQKILERKDKDGAGPDSSVLRASAEGAVGAPPSARASERLYAHARTRADQQEWLEQQVDAARSAEFTFQPTINPNTKAMFERQERNYGLEHIPIHERVADLQKFKNKRLHDLRSAIEESENETLTFAPVIDARSRQIADRGRKADQAAIAQADDERAAQQPENGAAAVGAAAQRKDQRFDVADRLLEEGRAADMRKRELAARLERQQAEEHAQKAPSTGTQNIAQSSEFVGASFAQRQALYQGVLDRKSQERRKQDADATAGWFQPNIGKSEEILAASRPSQFVETDAERINRLYKEDGEVREYKRNIREKQVYSDVTFEPRIDPLSKQLAQATSLNDLVDNPKGLAVREAVRKRVEAEQEAACTFKPKVVPYVPEGDLLGASYDGGGLYSWDPAHANDNAALNRSAASLHTTVSVVASKQTINMQEPEKMARNIRAQIIAKEEKRRQELMGREIDELRECTFAPRVGPPPSARQNQIVLRDQDGGATGAPVIRGLGRHLELKVLSIRKQEEQERREQEVFGVPNVEKYRKKEDGSTRVQPFQLSDRDLRPSRAVEELRKQQEQELTFTPVTELSLRREAIRSQARAVF